MNSPFSHRENRIFLLSCCAAGRVFAVVFFLIFLSTPAFADTAPPRAALLDLARKFVNHVGGDFKQADDYLLSLDPKARRRAQYKVEIPDGEMLLLQISIIDRKNTLKFPEPVIAFKKGDDMMVSLSDFFRVADFAIEVSPAQGSAAGWYIRKNQTFRLDVKTLTATVQGKDVALAPGDIEAQETDILMKATVLGKLFDFKADIFPGAQAMNVETKQKWPAVEKYERLHRREGIKVPPPELPRLDDPYKVVSVPNMDISTSRSFQRSREGQISRSDSYDLVATGDMLGHTARITASGSVETRLDEARITFKRQSENPDLLGGLHAREYEFGDIGSGVGLRATNRNPYKTSDVTAAIEGEMFPGWDADLYRGSQYVDNITNSDGTYRFEDVELSPGINNFTVRKYGPLGEIEEEEVNVYSSPRLQDTGGDGLYNVSVAAAQTDLWTKHEQHGVDKYTPVVDASYEWQAGENTAMNTSFSTSQQQGQQKTFTGLGVATYFKGTYLNANINTDMDTAYTASAYARRSLWGQNVSVGVGYTGEDFGALGKSHTVDSYTLDASVRGRLPYVTGTYNAATSYTEDGKGNWTQLNRFGAGTRVNTIGISTDLSQTNTGSADGSSSGATSGQTSLTGRLLGLHWRAGTSYDIDPEWSINSYNLDLSRGLAKNIKGNFSIQHDPNTDLNNEALSLVWSGKYVRMAPKITYDSQNNLGIFLNSNFGLAYNGYGKDIIMRGKDMTEFGGVSAFVYLDRNGSNKFDEGDEPIHDAIVEAVQSFSSATTDEKGEAFIYDLKANTITDVRLNDNSFFDPYMVPGFDGVSVVPRPGHEARIEFPVHNGGEMDGTIYLQPLQGKVRALRNVRLGLYDADGRLKQSATTSFDGFYLFQKIHPGRYFLLIDEKDAKNFGFLRPLPEEISFGYEGTIIYGHNITVNKTAPDAPGDIPLSMGADYTGYAGMNPALDAAALAGKSIVLNLGSYNSSMLMSVMWYKIRSRYGAIVGDTKLLVEPNESYPDPDTNLNTLRVKLQGYDVEDALRRCRALMARGLYCGVEALPQMMKEAKAGPARNSY